MSIFWLLFNCNKNQHVFFFCFSSIMLVLQLLLFVTFAFPDALFFLFLFTFFCFALLPGFNLCTFNQSCLYINWLYSIIIIIADGDFWTCGRGCIHHFFFPLPFHPVLHHFGPTLLIFIQITNGKKCHIFLLSHTNHVVSYQRGD